MSSCSVSFLCLSSCSVSFWFNSVPLSKISASRRRKIRAHVHRGDARCAHTDVIDHFWRMGSHATLHRRPSCCPEAGSWLRFARAPRRSKAISSEFTVEAAWARLIDSSPAWHIPLVLGRRLIGVAPLSLRVRFADNTENHQYDIKAMSQTRVERVRKARKLGIPPGERAACQRASRPNCLPRMKTYPSPLGSCSCSPPESWGPRSAQIGCIWRAPCLQLLSHPPSSSSGLPSAPWHHERSPGEATRICTTRREKRPLAHYLARE